MLRTDPPQLGHAATCVSLTVRDPQERHSKYPSDALYPSITELCIAMLDGSTLLDITFVLIHAKLF